MFKPRIFKNDLDRENWYLRQVKKDEQRYLSKKIAEESYKKNIAYL